MRGWKQDTTALVVGSALSGLLAYVVFALTTRALGSEAAAPVAVLWTYWSFAGAAFTFPLQHWITRSVTAHGEGVVRHTLPLLLLVVLGTSLVLGALAWLGRSALFGRDDLWFPALVVLVTLGSAVIGLVRGALSARRRFSAVAASLISENAVRCVAVAALMAAGVDNPVAYGWCLVAGYAVSLVWPSSFRFSRDRTESTVAHAPLTFLSGAASGQLLGQVVLTGGPVLLALRGGSAAEVTALFAALALFRAPYILALGAVSQLTLKVTALVLAEETATLRRIRLLIAAVAAAGVAGAAAVGAWLGPDLLRMIFGADVEFTAQRSALVAVASTLAVINLVLMVIAFAHDRPQAVALCWLTAVAVAAAGFVALTTVDPTDQAIGTLLLAEAVAFAALWGYATRSPRSTR